LIFETIGQLPKFRPARKNKIRARAARASRISSLHSLSKASYTIPNTMAQTNANAAYAATTLSLAAKFMGTAPVSTLPVWSPQAPMPLKIATMEPAQKSGPLSIPAKTRFAPIRSNGGYGKKSMKTTY
jgi:hypothetical protein